MKTDNGVKVLERLGTTESTTLVVRREEGGKIRVTSSLWEDAKVIGKYEVLEVRNVVGRLHIARGHAITMNGTRRSSRTIHTVRATA